MKVRREASGKCVPLTQPGEKEGTLEGKTDKWFIETTQLPKSLLPDRQTEREREGGERGETDRQTDIQPYKHKDRDRDRDNFFIFVI